MLTKTLRLSLVPALSLATLAVSALAGDMPQRSGAFGIKGGLFGDGTIDIASKHIGGYVGDFETDGSYSFGVFFERNIYSPVRAVLSVDIHDVKTITENQSLLDIAVGLKGHIGLPESPFVIRPGVSVGYGYLQKFGWLENSHYTTLKAAAEFALCGHKGTGVLCGVGLLWALSGGNDTYDITGGPMLLTRIGLLM